jgi:hypothetical protein
MKEFIELSKEEILKINGGASFAYRVGQACVMIWDAIDPNAGLSVGGITAVYDWFYS